MRRILTSATVAAAQLITVFGWTTGAAVADTECQLTDPQTGTCVISVEVENKNPDPEEPRDTGAGSKCYWDGTKQKVTSPAPGEVSCKTENGYWSNPNQCYIQEIKPAPPAGDQSWEGHEPGDGGVYSCYQPQTGIDAMMWADDAPPNAGAGPTPRQVAQLAIDSMNLRAIDIGIAPEPGPDSVGVVGMPVWMWAQNPDSTSFGPSTASASAGGITVSATGRVYKVTWLMGDGSSVACRTPGTPYDESFGQRPSPDCGYTYATSSSPEQSGRFTVTAISDWIVEWTGAGQTGVIRLNGLRRSVDIAVGEGQVLVQ